MQVEGLRAILQAWELRCIFRGKTVFLHGVKVMQGPICHF